jgi:tetratricopeptide (TPR) repeat protein
MVDQTSAPERGGPTTPDPIEIAMEAEAHDASPDSPAVRVLLKQERLIGWEIADRRMAVTLKALTGLAGLAAAVVVAVLVWNAAHADNLVIEAFSVPPALAERGITGESLARQLIEDLAKINEVGVSQDRQRRFAADWGKALALEVPETGVSLTQIDQWLKDKLGHQVHVNVEVVAQADGGLQLVAHSGAHAIAPALGDENGMPAMIQRVAEGVYAHEQARSYAGYLLNMRRLDEANAWLRPRTRLPIPRDRARAFNGLGLSAMLVDRTKGGEYFVRAINADPTFPYAYANLADVENFSGHLERALALYERQGQLIPNDRQIIAGARIAGANYARDDTTGLLGDFSGQLAARLEGRQLPQLGTTHQDLAEPRIATTLARLHDLRRARAELGFEEQTPDEARQKAEAVRAIDISGEDWAGAQTHGADAGLAPSALVLAHLGRNDEARALIGATRLDDVPAVIDRGRIAALTGDAKSADHWFSEAVRMAPSLPMANAFWGRALLDRGDLAAAIARLTAANKQGPRFADPISWWGEALLRQGKAREAIAKFREANAYAPNWGRNHLLWGEALTKLGKTDEARVQWRAAAGMDLTSGERAELARVQGAR